MNFVAELDIGTRDLPPTDWNRVVDNSVPLEPFKYWKFPWLDIPKMIENSDAIYEFPMVDRDPVKQWTFGHVTLLGDAAHPMHPRGSNGASQAIFDAAVLSECLAKERDSGAGGDWIGRALKEYEDRRMPPCAAIVLSNRKLGPEEVLEVVEHRAPNGWLAFSF